MNWLTHLSEPAQEESAAEAKEVITVEDSYPAQLLVFQSQHACTLSEQFDLHCW